MVDDSLDNLTNAVSLLHDVLDAADLGVNRIEDLLAATADAAHRIRLEIVIVVLAAVLSVVIVPLATKAVRIFRVTRSVFAQSSARSATATSAAHCFRDEIFGVRVTAAGRVVSVELAATTLAISEFVCSIVALILAHHLKTPLCSLKVLEIVSNLGPVDGRIDPVHI